MTCESARSALLEADREALEGRGADPLSAHLRSCARCELVAAALLERERSLADALASRAPPPSPERAQAIVRLASASRDARVRAARVLVPTAAAAALALALLLPEARPARSGGGTRPGEAEAPTSPRIDPPPGRSVAVMRTNDPSITVVWLLDGGE
jgi:hypothetical protein